MSEELVELWGQSMTRDWADMLLATQLRAHYTSAGEVFRRIPYGSETFRQPVEAARQPCRHCNTVFGKLHEPMCDHEQCPKCNWQLMSCDCTFDGL
jgi:hypothetical protein